MKQRVIPASWRLLAGTIAFTIFVHLLHEAAHALTAMALGISGNIGTNTVRFSSDVSDNAALLTSASGPVLMMIFAVLAAISRWRWAPTILLIVLFQRVMAAVMTAIFTPNDEARIGLLLGLGQWPIFVLTIGLAAILFVHRYRADHLGWRWFAISYAGFSIAITLVVFGDDLLPRFAF